MLVARPKKMGVDRGRECMRYVLAVCFILAGCAKEPPVPAPPWVGRHKNACLPEAIVMAQGLRASGIQAKVLSIHTDRWGHAVCMYFYPPGKNQMWVWDSHWKSVPLRAWADDAEAVGRAWMKWTLTDAVFRYAYFHE